MRESPFIHFITDINPLEKIWNNMKSCITRGIHLYNEDEYRIRYYSYGEIYRKAISAARLLYNKHIVYGDKILLSAKTTIYFPVLWIACFLMGTVPVPLPPRDIYFAENAFCNRIKEIVPFFSTYLCYDNELEDIRKVGKEKKICIRLISIQELFSNIEKAENTNDIMEVNRSLEHTAFIQFTSGSTSHPKGIMVTYKNLFSNIYGLCERWKVDRETSFFGSWLPLYHDMGLVGLLLLSLFTQSNLVLLPSILFSKNPGYFIEILSTYKVTICCMTNFSLEMILRRFNPEKVGNVCLENLKYMGIGAEPVQINTLKRFEETFKPYGLNHHAVSPGYGLAESTLAVTVADLDFGYLVSEKDGHTYPTVGKPLFNTTITIENKDNDNTIKGRIKIKSDSVATHALINGKEERIIDKMGFYDTKDIGYFEGDQLVVMGRSDNMFIINGENYFPHEIETIIIHSGLIKRKRIACFAVPSLLQNSQPVKIILVYETRHLSETEKETIHDSMKKIVLRNTGLTIDEIIAVKPKTIPMTTSGKLQHSALKKLYIEGRLEENLVYRHDKIEAMSL